jgi:transcriptional regulator with XRE-family HTH domain
MKGRAGALIELIDAFKAEKDWSERKIALRAGISPQTIAYWRKHPEGSPDKFSLANIAREMGIEVEILELRIREIQQKPKESNPEFNIDRLKDLPISDLIRLSRNILELIDARVKAA